MNKYNIGDEVYFDYNGSIYKGRIYAIYCKEDIIYTLGDDYDRDYILYNIYTGDDDIGKGIYMCFKSEEEYHNYIKDEFKKFNTN